MNQQNGQLYFSRTTCLRALRISRSGGNPLVDAVAKNPQNISIFLFHPSPYNLEYDSLMEPLYYARQHMGNKKGNCTLQSTINLTRLRLFVAWLHRFCPAEDTSIAIWTLGISITAAHSIHPTY